MLGVEELGVAEVALGVGEALLDHADGAPREEETRAAGVVARGRLVDPFRREPLGLGGLALGEEAGRAPVEPRDLGGERGLGCEGRRRCPVGGLRPLRPRPGRDGDGRSREVRVRGGAPGVPREEPARDDDAQPRDDEQHVPRARSLGLGRLRLDDGLGPRRRDPLRLGEDALEERDRLEHRLGAPLLVARDEAHARLLDRRGEARHEVARARGRRGEGERERLERRVRLEGRVAREELEVRRPERVDVRARVERLALGLLGGHVERRAEDHAHLRRRRVVRARGARDRLGEAEVRDLHAAVPGDEDVGRLHVAVEDADRVRGVEAARGGEDDLGRVLPGERAALLHELGGRGPVHELHGDVRDPVLDARPVDLDDLARDDLRGGLRLALEARDRLLVVGEDDLDHDVPLELRVAREVDGAHPASPEEAHDLVLPERARRERGRREELARRSRGPGPRICGRRHERDDGPAGAFEQWPRLSAAWGLPCRAF